MYHSRKQKKGILSYSSRVVCQCGESSTPEQGIGDELLYCGISKDLYNGGRLRVIVEVRKNFFIYMK